MKHKEYNLQVSVCRFLDLQFKEVLYLSDTVANCKLTIPQAARNKKIQKQGFKCPDILILEPNKYYKGLFIELKTESPFKINGNIKASQNDHLKKQLETLQQLEQKGYFACFSWSLEQTIDIINKYMNER